MTAISLLYLTVSASMVVAQSVTLFPAGNSSALAQVLGVTPSCVDALNTTVSCDSGTFQWLHTVDQYMWSQDNLTALCTSTCESSLSDWNAAVGSACNGQEMIHYTQLVPASTIPGLLQYHYSVACLESSTGDSCMIESQNWVGSDVIRWDPDSCNTGNATYDNPMCFEGNFTLSEITPDQELLSNLYNQSMLCSDCFVKMMYQRLMNPYLPDADFSDYLVEQFDDIQSVCSTTMALTTRALPTYANVTMATATATTTGSATATTCSGQIIPTASPALSCDQLSEMYGVSTGDLVVATQDWDCGITAPLCLPANCTVDLIAFGETCDSLIQQYSSASGTSITLNQFMAWNGNILGLCDDLQGLQYVCSGPPGGIYSMPSIMVAAPTATTAYTTTAVPSQPTPSGTTPDCGNYYNVVAGDDCEGICLKTGITFPQFQALNPEIDSNCTNLWLNYAYCVANVTQPPISTDGTCGPNSATRATCVGSTFGDCCNNVGQCGSGNDYCDYGSCFSGACLNQTSPDGTCGPANNYYDCASGYCCSTSGYCGNTTDYCGPGNCYNGACDPDNGGPSLDGTCGPTFSGNKTCTGTQFGECCSIYGYCGNGTAYCGAGSCYSGACQ